MKETYNLTNPQKTIWFTEEFYKGTSIENIAGTANIADKVDYKKLAKAINIFIERNDSFRLKFINENNVIKQYVDEFKAFSLETVSVNDEKDVKRIEKELAETPLEVLNSFLFKFKLFKYPDGHGGFVVVMHHLISDAWTTGMLVSEIIDIYDALLENEDTSFELAPSYIDYIASENKYLNSEKFEDDKKFWNNLFPTVPEVATIPSLASDKNKISSAAKRKLFTIPSETMELINAFCKENKISAFNFFMGIFSVYLSRVSGLDNFVIGTPILNRSTFKEKHTTGMFISVVPFRVNLNHENSFIDFAKTISRDFFDIFRHQKYPYEALLEDLRKESPNIPNLFNILLSYQNMRSNKQSTKTNYESKWLFNNNISDDIEIHFFDVNDTGNINIAYDFKTCKYSPDDILALHARILNMINQVLENTSILLKNIEIVTPDEKEEILYKFNNTKMDYPKDKTIVQLFEEQVEKTPDNIAVVFEDQKLTYRELNEKANQLANYLLDNGVTPDLNIGIVTNRSITSIIGIIAILKVNCTYVPIDPLYPTDRITHMITSSQVKFVLYDGSSFSTSPEIKLINISYEHYSNYSNKFFINTSYNCNHNLYIIFTSGSTGLPKGVCISHKNIINLIYFEMQKTCILKGHCNILQFATMSFDVSYQEIYSALLSGNTLVLISDDKRKNIHTLASYIINKKVNTLFIPPAYLKILCSDLDIVHLLSSCVKNIITAGEKLVISDGIQELLKSGVIIHNHYGPAETHVATTLTINSLSYGSEPPIGRAISNSSVYILDKENQLCPINTIGQIAICGDCVGNGYINNNKLTSEKFIKNSLSKSAMYLTGDLGYYSSNGLIHFIGRNDFQVKINGFRIEVEEVEKAINSCPNITNCIVIPLNVKGTSKSLVAYYTSNSKISTANIKSYLVTVLPSYMIPSYFVEMDHFEFTTNGKINRKALPQCTLEAHNVIVPVRNDIDTCVIKLFKNILKITSVSIDDDFFDLGGDSLSAINLCAQIQNEFNVQLFVKDILEHPTIKDISDIISSNLKSSEKYIIKPVNKSDFYAVSSAQKRMFFASSVAGEASTLYNVPGGVILDGTIDVEKLEKCLNTLINRHEALRTCFILNGDEVAQKIIDKIDFKIELQNDSNFEDLDTIFKDFVKPFDLSIAPLFRAKFISFTNGKSALLIDMHHIISDGSSLNIFINELCKLYNDESLEPLDITYKDFATFENDRLSSGELNEAESYWVNQFKDDIPVLNLPTNYPRPAMQSFEGRKIYSTISSEQTEKLNVLAKSLGVTPYMMLLSIYYILLYKYTSQDDIVVGSPVVGRDIAQTYNLIGMFVNTLALKNKIDSSKTFKEFLEIVKQNCLNAYKYQTYPFNELVEKLDVKRDTSRSPLFDTMFTYQNNGYEDIKFKNIKSAKYYIPDTNISKFDLSLEIIPSADGLKFSFEYATKLFKEDFINNLSNHYINILNTILENSDIKIADINMLSEAETNKILYEFNNTKMDYPNDKTIVQLFEEQVAKTPDNIAVVFEEQKLTYKELNEKANSLARFLNHNDIGKSDIVPVLMNRSIDLIISMLGIIKSGAAYLPISPEMPAERIDYIIQNSNAKVIITKSSQNLIFNNSIKIIDLESFDFSKYSNKNLSNEIKMLDLLYVIYTSGSTGNPKGVKLCHHNLANFIASFTKLYGNISSKDKLLATTNISFDVSIFEFFISLLNGATLYLYDEPSVNDIFKYCKTIIKNKITFLYIPPNILEDVYNILSSYASIPVNKILLGVEPIKSSTIKKYYTLNPDLKIINAYGPTECTICSTAITLDDNVLKDYKIIPIGKPLSNLNIFILDKNMNPVPVDVPGEIYISGDNVARGYLGNRELTEKSFISIPKLNCKLAYKTGDLAKWNEDGLISFIGRNDYQIKINGHRIELGEIESCVYLYPNINKTIVLVDKNNKLICYFSSSKQININDLKAFMQRKLPLYFIPNFFIQVDKFKLTSNGKIDRKALKKLKAEANSSYEAPQTPYQENLVEAFKTVLGLDKVGITDNFFELGGDSLLAIKLQIEAFNKGLDLSYKDIFKYPTIKQLSENVSSAKSNEFNDEYDYTEIDNLLKNNSFAKRGKLSKNKFKNILLTGSTGFLGAHILDALLKNTKCNVYCLIRAKDNNDPQIRLLNTLRFYFGNKYDRQIFNRIIVIEGDIKNEKLGLNDLYYEEIGNTIDCVINSAAIVKHYGNIDTFNSTNVQGAKNIIHFCKDFNCKLFHLSTLSVSGNIFETDSYKVADLSSDIIFNEQSLYIGQDLSNVYIYTKFIAERLILENVASGKLDAKIIRLRKYYQ